MFLELWGLMVREPGTAGTIRGLPEAAQGQRQRDRGGKGCGSGSSRSSDGDGVRLGKRGPVALHRRTFATAPRRSAETRTTILWAWKRCLDTA